MKRILASFCIVFLFASFLYAKDYYVDKEGKEWLERFTGSAEINVNGVWYGENWGDITLDQPQGSREITGDGDLWEIHGIVSGKQAILVFSRLDKVEYLATLEFDQEDTLRGTYTDEPFKDKPSKEKILMQRKSYEVVQPALGAENETARVIMYMKKSQGKPGLFLDGRQIVWMDKGYISFRLAPGPHEMYMRGDGFRGWGPSDDPIKLDARAGETYFYEAGRWGTWVKSWKMKPKDEKTLMKDIRKRKPLEAKFVLTDSIVILDPIPQKQ